MIEHVEKLCKKVLAYLYSMLSRVLRVCYMHVVQVHVQVVDIFDNPDVVMAKFIQSLLDRVLQVSRVLLTIRESVDSLCRDDADMPKAPYIHKACASKPQSSSQCLLVSTVFCTVSSLHPTSFLMRFALVCIETHRR